MDSLLEEYLKPLQKLLLSSYLTAVKEGVFTFTPEEYESLGKGISGFLTHCVSSILNNSHIPLSAFNFDEIKLSYDTEEKFLEYEFETNSSITLICGVALPREGDNIITEQPPELEEMMREIGIRGVYAKFKDSLSDLYQEIHSSDDELILAMRNELLDEKITLN